MNRTRIINLTISQIKKIANIDDGISDECLIASGKASEGISRYPFRIDAFIIGLCTNGEATISTNLTEFRLQKNSMFIYTPQCILQLESKVGSSVSLIALSPKFMENIHIDLKKIIPLFLHTGDFPCLALTDEESESLQQYFAQIKKELLEPQTSLSQEVVFNLIAAVIYKIGNLLLRHPTMPQNGTMTDRSDEYFRRFIRLLSENFRTERNVGFYARQLCITPKYLTTVIKRTSGQPVSKWIDRYVILEAKMLLKYSDMSIQEIAYCLNFPNQSFFGSYFKRQTGMSPSTYKAQ